MNAQNRVPYPLALAAVVALLLATAGVARAHFVWIAADTAEGKHTANVWFSEEAAPGESNLIARISKATAELATADGKTLPLTLTRSPDKENAALQSALQELPAGLTASCDYGVITRDDDTFHLMYFARYMRMIDGATAPAAAKALPIDIVPSTEEGQLRVTVVDGGAPTGKLEVVAISPKKNETTLKTDDKGQATLGPIENGRWSIRARSITKGDGELDGKKYGETRRYVTLALDVSTTGGAAAPVAAIEPAAAEPAAAEPAASEPGKCEVEATKAEPASAAPALTALELLKKARDSRVVWRHFPGFTANLQIGDGESVQQGKVDVSAKGDVTFEGFDKVPGDVQRDLNSVVAHRLPSESQDECSFADKNENHPLGRLINLDYDTEMGSSYRILGDVVRQVNRNMGDGKFTISVLDIFRNAEGKYLPSYYTMSFWNADKTLNSSITVQEDWRREGKFDVLARRFAVKVEQGTPKYSELAFSDYKFKEADAKAEAKIDAAKAAAKNIEAAKPHPDKAEAETK